MVKNAAEGKRENKSKYCKICGTLLTSDKDMRRKMCKKHHKLERQRWRTHGGARITKRARKYGR